MMCSTVEEECLPFIESNIYILISVNTYSADKCPDIKMYTKKDNIHHRWIHVGWATSQPDQDGWAHVTGLHSLEEVQAGAQYVYMYYGGSNVVYDMVLDDMEMKYLPKQCHDLVLNSDFSDRSAFWETNDRNVVKLSFEEGVGGEGDHAMRVHRTSTWNGHAMRQRLDPRCFIEGEVRKYLIWLYCDITLEQPLV